MGLNYFVSSYGLKVADAIVVRKRVFAMVDHYVLYMGQRGGEPVFIANFQEGVKELTKEELSDKLLKYGPVRIEKFEGTEEERRYAFNRAWSRVGERAYNYLKNNCEHFKNWVHKGENFSGQVDSVGDVMTGLGAGTAIVGLVAKNSKTALWGTGIVLLGAMLKGLAGEK